MAVSTELLDRLAAEVELRSRGNVAFRWREPVSKGAEGYVELLIACLDGAGTPDSEAVEYVAARIVAERQRHTNDGMRLSR